MRGVYSFAGIPVEINSIYERVHNICADYRTEQPHEVSVSTTEESIRYEEKAYIKEMLYEGITPEKLPDDYLELSAVYRKIADAFIPKNILLMHGSAIAVDGEAYIFTAASGTGKSTHAGLWRKVFGGRAVMINDDKPLLRIEPGGVIACGTPWDGKHRRSTNIMLPLRSICILERGETNSIKEISFEEAYPMLLQQTNRPADKALMIQTLGLMEKMRQHVKIYKLKCNQEPEAAIVSYNGMKKGE